MGPGSAQESGGLGQSFTLGLSISLMANADKAPSLSQWVQRSETVSPAVPRACCAPGDAGAARSRVTGRACEDGSGYAGREDAACGWPRLPPWF